MPTVCLIGKPNVGKSTIFNRLIKEDKSIVLDTPGVTRDRIYGNVTYGEKSFLLIDTGGLEEGKDNWNKDILMQATLAIDEADVIVFVVDGKEEISSSDLRIRDMLMKTSKKVIVAVNKVDNEKRRESLYHFYELGFSCVLPISASHNLGFLELLEEITRDFPSSEQAEDNRLKFCFIGRPNVGKSSLINALLNEERVIVSDVAGTTRDAIDTYHENEYGKYTLIDTAGIRRHSKIKENIERYSIMRTLLAIERADVCLMMIDAKEGVTEQDTKIAGEAHDAGKGIIIVVNKWDEIEKDNNTFNKFKKEIYNKLAYLTYAPIIFISAKTGQRVDKLFDMINNVAKMNALRVPTGVLNQVIDEAIAITQPPTDKGRRLKILYVTQASTKPPTFIVFVNNKDLFHFSYERYLVNHIRKEFGLEGTPIRMIAREKLEK